MIRQKIDVVGYWKVIVYYDMDCNLFYFAAKDLRSASFSTVSIRNIEKELFINNAKAVTCSNEEKYISIVIFIRHKSVSDYINSIVHEVEHVKQAMLNAYRVLDEGEPPAYTIGYLVGQMWRVFRRIIH